ncbi:MAG: hypothetical protein U0457_17570 [Candidatus Sericytochromatia bacterium]
MTELNLTGAYSNIEKDTLDSIKNTKITPNNIKKIEDIAKGGKAYSEGEKLLISNLKTALKTNASISLNFVEDINEKSSNTLNIKNNQVYVNSNSEIEKTVKNDEITQKSISFSKSFINLPDIQKKQAIEILSAKPKNLKELSSLEAKIPNDIKKIFSSLGINNLKTDKEVDSFFNNKSINKLPNFLQNLSSLNKIETETAIKTIDLLSEKNISPDFRIKIKEMNDKLGSESANKVGKVLNSFNLYIPSTNLKAPTSEDLSSRTKTMYMGEYGDLRSAKADYIRDALSVAKKEGFSLSITSIEETPEALKNRIINDLQKKEGLSLEEAKDLTNNHLKIISVKEKTPEWAEDNKFFTINGNLKTLPYIEDNKILAKMEKFAMSYVDPKSPNFGLEGSHSIGGSEVDPYELVNKTMFQGAVNENNQSKSALEIAKKENKEITVTRTYNEGGNMLVGTLPNGESYAVVGRDGVLASTFKLEADYAKDKNLVPEFNNINKKIASMEKEGKLDTLTIKETISKLYNAGELPKGVNPTKRAKEFLAKMEIVKEDIFPKDLGISKAKIAYVPQTGFHIDMSMRPMKPGQIAINDYDENIKLLQEAKKRTQVGSEEEKELDSIITQSQLMKQVMEPVNKLVEQELKNKGLEVIKVPAVMKGDNSIVNFINATSGTTKGTNRQFYMTNYTPLKPLRDAYESYMKNNFDIDKIYWMGDSKSGQTEKYSGSEISLIQEGGMDCRENREEF